MCYKFMLASPETISYAMCLTYKIAEVKTWAFQKTTGLKAECCGMTLHQKSTQLTDCVSTESEDQVS